MVNGCQPLLRKMPASNEGPARKLASTAKKCDVQYRVVFDAIRQLMARKRPPNAGRSDSTAMSAESAKYDAVRIGVRLRTSPVSPVLCA
jgi:hypothetical protein